MPPQTGAGFLLGRGQRLRVVDPLGEQVSDLIAFARDDKRRMAVVGPEHRLRQHDLPDDRPRPLLEPQSADVHDPER